MAALAHDEVGEAVEGLGEFLPGDLGGGVESGGEVLRLAPRAGAGTAQPQHGALGFPGQELPHLRLRREGAPRPFTRGSAGRFTPARAGRRGQTVIDAPLRLVGQGQRRDGLFGDGEEAAGGAVVDLGTELRQPSLEARAAVPAALVEDIAVVSEGDFSGSAARGIARGVRILQGFGGLPVARQGARFTIRDSRGRFALRAHARFTGGRLGRLGRIEARFHGAEHHAELVGLEEAVEGLLVLFGQHRHVLGGGREGGVAALENGERRTENGGRPFGATVGCRLGGECVVHLCVLCVLCDFQDRVVRRPRPYAWPRRWPTRGGCASRSSFRFRR